MKKMAHSILYTLIIKYMYIDVKVYGTYKNICVQAISNTNRPNHFLRRLLLEGGGLLLDRDRDLEREQVIGPCRASEALVAGSASRRCSGSVGCDGGGVVEDNIPSGGWTA